MNYDDWKLASPYEGQPDGRDVIEQVEDGYEVEMAAVWDTFSQIKREIAAEGFDYDASDFIVGCEYRSKKHEEWKRGKASKG